MKQSELPFRVTRGTLSSKSVSRNPDLIKCCAFDHNSSDDRLFGSEIT